MHTQKNELCVTFDKNRLCSLYYFLKYEQVYESDKSKHAFNCHELDIMLV